MKNINLDCARALAEALERKGIVSDAPEADPNPLWAAQQAFFVCWGHGQVAAWRDLIEQLTAPSVPSAAYYRKLAELCKRALRHPELPDDLREPVAFGWGFFSAMLKAVSGPQTKTSAEVDG